MSPQQSASNRSKVELALNQIKVNHEVLMLSHDPREPDFFLSFFGQSGKVLFRVNQLLFTVRTKNVVFRTIGRFGRDRD